jgi:glycosyltransferase involved in cell wall biosynthesis
VPQGFAFDDFAASGQNTQLQFPKEKPIIGFVGQMSERLDFALLHELISNNTQWNFVFVGPKHHEPNVAYELNEQEIDRLFEYENCVHFDSQPKNTILSIINNFDICIIPYNINFAFNRFSYPMKIFEYFYAGKPIVSTPIEELKRFQSLITLASSASDFTIAITQLLEKPWSKSRQAQQKRLAMKISWTEKILAISKHL